MAQNKFRVGGLALVLMLTLLPATAFSAPKITPGSKCKIVNQKITYLNKTYTCLKSGKNLKWNKGVLVAKPKPTVVKVPISVATPKPEATSSPIPTISPEPMPTQKPVEPSDALNFKGSMLYDIRDGQLIRRADSGSYFETDSRAESSFDPIRIKAYRELNKNQGNRLHPNVEFKYSISDSFPKFLIEYTKRELDEAAALWDSFIGRKITVNVYLVTEKDRENIKSNRWLQMNLPNAFTRFDLKRERPFITGGGGYWNGDDGWFGNIYLGTASYLDPTYVNYEWPQVARHEFVHLVQDFAYARNGKLRGNKAQFDALQPQNFREGSGNTISYLTAFRNIGWSSDAMDWLIWQRAEYTKNWKTVKTVAEVKALMIATDVGTPDEAFEQSYAVGALMYEWLIGTYGFDGYKKVINEFASVSSFGQAVQNALGVKKEDLYDQMAEYVFQSYQRVYKP
jgi:hypothetical protein